MINVTRPFLPPLEEYVALLKRAWDLAWLTNQGVLAQELEGKLKEFIGSNNVLFCSNGTVALQLALKGLNITKEVITTPFSYVATTNSILWEGASPVFVDILPDTFGIDPQKIEDRITKDTQAILATHVYGLPCDVEAIQKIADKNNLKVIYDAAHAFGCTFKGKSLLSYGDISTCSFHATKIFHTGEGGCVVCKSEDTFKQLYLYRSFGHILDDYHTIGINGKNSELHAAMGLAILPKLSGLIQERRTIFDRYSAHFSGTNVQIAQPIRPDFSYNYAYFPAIFESERIMLKVKDNLLENAVNTRRYFYPSLNTLNFLQKTDPCPISEDISLRVLCLPMYPGLPIEDVDRIAKLVKEAIS